MTSFLKSRYFFIVVFLILVATGLFWVSSKRTPTAPTVPDEVSADEYLANIQPIFNARCVACHSCYNSPCQLDLASHDGVARGGSKIDPYDFPLLEAREPSRIGIDAHGDQWRKKGFFPVINSERSLLTSILRKPDQEVAAKKYEAEKSRLCPSTATNHALAGYFKEEPFGHMPYGFPSLSKDQYDTLTSWVQQGAKGPSVAAREALARPSTPVRAKEIREWEDFLNAPDFRTRLSARYIYEHLFLSHLYFRDTPHEFFRLVRAKNREGTPQEIATTRPYDSAGKEFYYRFQKYTFALVVKTHMPYELSRERKERWRELFFKGDWLAGQDEMPAYGPAGANAFKTFARIPAENRYRFLLDDAYYHIMTFIKGPVCRGQTALNVINDHFWVMFVDPKFDLSAHDPTVLKAEAARMSPPASAEDQLKLFKNFREGYWSTLQAKYRAYEKKNPKFGPEAIWDGDGHNPSAVLTVYRHFDSAQVLRGTHGDYPETVWVMDYQVFEDIYYNLVAGYDVFGPIVHQLNTRLYMEISRIASEDMFLNYLPKNLRAKERASWSRNTPESRESTPQKIVELIGGDTIKKMNTKYPYLGSKLESSSPYAKIEFLKEVLHTRIRGTARGAPEDLLNRETSHEPPESEQILTRVEAEKWLQTLTNAKSQFSRFMPDVSFLRVRLNDRQNYAYTLIHNKAHFNVSMLLFEDERRDVANDRLEILPGFAASYPNYYFDISAHRVPAFARALLEVSSDADFKKFSLEFGVPRTSPQVWPLHDWFVEESRAQDPVEGAGFDLNRYL